MQIAHVLVLTEVHLSVAGWGIMLKAGKPWWWDHWVSQLQCSPGVESASNRNQYQEFILG
jgi:hypothetical protein